MPSPFGAHVGDVKEGLGRRHSSMLGFGDWPLASEVSVVAVGSLRRTRSACSKGPTAHPMRAIKRLTGALVADWSGGCSANVVEIKGHLSLEQVRVVLVLVRIPFSLLSFLLCRVVLSSSADRSGEGASTAFPGCGFYVDGFLG